MPIPPNSDFPASVVMPTTNLTMQFAKLGAPVLSYQGNRPIGYPRFVINPQIAELINLIMPGHLPFPSLASAHSAKKLEDFYGDGLKIIESEGLYWIKDTPFTTDAWQHAGLGLSPRQADAILHGSRNNDITIRDEALNTIRQDISFHTGVLPEDIYAFPTGAAATYFLNEALISIGGNAPSIQFLFPYTDTHSIQGKFGPNMGIGKNVVDLRNGNYEELKATLDSGIDIRSIFTELPSNPQLTVPDMKLLSKIIQGRVPLVVDDTLATAFNIDDSKYPRDVVARIESLTKYYSSVGDAMMGIIILRRDCPHYEAVKKALDATYENTIWSGDAQAVADNGRHFSKIMPIINSNAEALVNWMQSRYVGNGGPIQNIFYPSKTGPEQYGAVLKEGGGYGGLFTLEMNDPNVAYRYFDALQISKGPSLGTFYSMACLYTWLAHSKGMNSVNTKFGVRPHYVRESTGIEPLEQLIGIHEEALNYAIH